jgi:hypothetical protein
MFHECVRSSPVFIASLYAFGDVFLFDDESSFPHSLEFDSGFSSADPNENEAPSSNSLGVTVLSL